jgi:hypothetical protein
VNLRTGHQFQGFKAPGSGDVEGQNSRVAYTEH